MTDKARPPRTPTTRFFERATRDVAPGQTFSPTFIPRLTYRTHEFASDPMALVKAANEAEHDFFLDTSIVDVETPPEFWDLLLARRRIHLVPGVVRELESWLEQHPEHPMAAPTATRDPHIQFISRESLEPSIWDGVRYYFNLLIGRKQAMRLYEDQLRSELGRDPTDDEVSQRVLTQLGERAYLFAKKGRARLDELSHADEELVCVALAHAVQTGRPAMIVTRDQDVLEQTYKLTSLVDLDYRSMLLADSYALEFASYRPSRLLLDEDALKEVFVDSEENVMFDAAGLRERVLPRQFEVAPISCVRVAGATTQVSFGAETRMRDIFRIKGQTRGLNTNRLGRRNCHLTLWPLDVSRRLKSMAVVAFERRIDVGDRLSFSVLDFNRVLSTNEPIEVV